MFAWIRFLVPRRAGRVALAALLAGGSLALGGCERLPDDSVRDVTGPPREVTAALSRLDGGTAAGQLDLPQILREDHEDGTRHQIDYWLHSAEGQGDGLVRFVVEPGAERGSRVTVEVRMPPPAEDTGDAYAQIRNYRGMQLVSDAVDKWAQGRAAQDASDAQLDAVDDTLGLLLLSLSPKTADAAVRRDRKQPVLASFVSDYVEWNGSDDQRRIDKHQVDLAKDRAAALADQGDADGAPMAAAANGDDDDGWGASTPLGADPTERKGKRDQVDWGTGTQHSADAYSDYGKDGYNPKG